jgi:hypothetical protein
MEAMELLGVGNFFPRVPITIYMCADALLQLAAQARRDPNSVIRDLEAMPSPDRGSVLANILTHYTAQSFRPYTPNVDQAIRQLVANEFVATPQERNWGKFYKSTDSNGCNFLRRYQKIWAESDFSEPEMLTYVLQTVVRSKAEAAPLQGAALLMLPHQPEGPRKATPLTVGAKSVDVYICGDYEPTAAGRNVLIEGLKWVLDAGYQLPAAVEVRDTPGGYHYYNDKMCKKFPVEGSAIKVGLIPQRAPCTARHELSHVIYAQQSSAVRQKVKSVFAQAMRADYGLIFNDEYYMVDYKFLHAGHPMENDSEFFAGALHAYSQHRDKLMVNINAATTPTAVKAYALGTIQLLDQVLHTK